MRTKMHNFSKYIQLQLIETISLEPEFTLQIEFG